MPPVPSRVDALAIWQAAVDAVTPDRLFSRAFHAADDPLMQAVRTAPCVRVVGAGKAGAGMSAALEMQLAEHLDRVIGIVNVPAGTVRLLRAIRLHAARPDGSNHPTAVGVAGSEEMLRLFAEAGPEDIGICLLSGGGSALLPAPADGISLADKQAITRLMHHCGASIDELNTVRKHLSRIKGGQLARAFRGRMLFSLVLSDVVGDPLDVIASGPTVADPSTFADAWRILDKYQLLEVAPVAVRQRLELGRAGQIEETPKILPGATNHHRIIGNNAMALAAAQQEAEQRGYPVLNLGAYIEGETCEVATVLAGLVRSIRHDGNPVRPPVCLLVGGETTVTLSPNSGKGGRNQEFVLAMLTRLGSRDWGQVIVLSGGTDGEDGPTDAAGAVVDESVWDAIPRSGSELAVALTRHDAYPLLDRVGALLKSGLTGTNVMDVRVILIGSS